MEVFGTTIYGSEASGTRVREYDKSSSYDLEAKSEYPR